MTFGTLSFLITTPETWVPDLGGPNHGFPYLSGAGRLVIKDIVILAGAVTLLGTDIRRILKARLGCAAGEKSCSRRNELTFLPRSWFHPALAAKPGTGEFSFPRKGVINRCQDGFLEKEAVSVPGTVRLIRFCRAANDAVTAPLCPGHPMNG